MLVRELLDRLSKEDPDTPVCRAVMHEDEQGGIDWTPEICDVYEYEERTVTGTRKVLVIE